MKKKRLSVQNLLTLQKFKKNTMIEGTTIELIENKIFIKESPEFENIISLWKFQNKRIVFTNGCFDILHLGHITTLANASDLGDVLIVGINTDRSVRRLKGAGRPIVDQHSRAMKIAAMACVDAVVYFDEETPIDVIKNVLPDVLVKGGDYKPKSIAGYDIVTKHGGTVVVLDYMLGYSTTEIEKRIKQSKV